MTLNSILKKYSTLRCCFSDDPNFDVTDFVKVLEDNGFQVESVENTNKVWMNNAYLKGEPMKHYDIKMSNGLHLSFTLLAYPDYSTRELIIYRNGYNW